LLLYIPFYVGGCCQPGMHHPIIRARTPKPAPAAAPKAADAKAKATKPVVEAAAAAPKAKPAIAAKAAKPCNESMLMYMCAEC
jgi:hypothetical protein